MVAKLHGSALACNGKLSGFESRLTVKNHKLATLAQERSTHSSYYKKIVWSQNCLAFFSPAQPDVSASTVYCKQ
jgi:hypothetical protein